MKTIFSVLVAALILILPLPLISFQIKANNLVPQTATEGNRALAQTAVGSQADSSRSIGRKPSEAEDFRRISYTSRQVKNANPISPAGQTKQEISPLFQVSPDCHDQIQLSVSNGIVTVQGSVGSDELARQLLKQYSRMAGVREVRNRLTVRMNPDAEIAVKLREALSRDPDTHIGGIAVTVCNGIVFFSGSVSSEEERARAEELARGLQGVRRVSNGLRFLPRNRYPVRLTRK